jgi:hypothetical protein
MVRVRLWIALVPCLGALAGCDTLLGIHELGVGTVPPGDADVAPDGMLILTDANPVTPQQNDAPRAPDIDARQCWGSTLQLCTTTPSTASLVVMGNLDTDNDADCDAVLPQVGQGGGNENSVAMITGLGSGGAAPPDVCVKSALDWTVASLRVTGHRPLVLFAIDTITIVSTLDDAYGISTAADSNDVQCPVLAAASKGAGASGGAYSTAGGGGGNTTSATGSPATAPLAAPSAIRGGCNGQESGGAGGAGGGAVYLLAGNEIDIGDNIFATGTGGGGGSGAPTSGSTTAGGGGGGGTGGFIGLEAGHAITTDSGYVVVARGCGGGGGGGAAYVVQQGKNGVQYNGQTGGTGKSGGANAASGGAGGTNGGGNGGSASPSKNGNNGASSGGGGGGGGGDGVIWVTGGSLPTGVASPPPIVR